MHMHIYKLNWARRTSRGWRDEWDDTALQTYSIHCYSLLQTQDLTSEPCGLRLSSLLLGHGCSPHYWFITGEQRRNILFLWSLNARAGFESAISRLSKQAVLTTAPRSPPYRPYSISSGIRSIYISTKLYRLPLVRARDDLTLFCYI